MPQPLHTPWQLPPIFNQQPFQTAASWTNNSPVQKNPESKSKVLVEKLTDFDVNVLRKFAKVDAVVPNSNNIIAAPVFNNDDNNEEGDPRG